MDIVIIGSGNTATVLATLIKNAGHPILQVYSRHLINAEDLAETLHCPATHQWSEINPNADLYVVALSDEALVGLGAHLKINHGIVVHTAGSVGMEVLKPIGPRYGVLYPLQSLRKEKTDYDDIPLLVDGSTPEVLEQITDFAESLSHFVRRANDDYRQKLHVAAVIVNNFPNHLYTLADMYCQQSGLNFDLLKPLISETGERIKNFSPGDMQTGPAARGDESTIRRHLAQLEGFSNLQQLYRTLTNSIVELHKKNNKPA